MRVREVGALVTRWMEWNDDQVRSWDSWVATLPEAVQLVARKYPPHTLLVWRDWNRIPPQPGATARFAGKVLTFWRWPDGLWAWGSLDGLWAARFADGFSCRLEDMP